MERKIDYKGYNPLKAFIILTIFLLIFSLIFYFITLKLEEKGNLTSFIFSLIFMIIFLIKISTAYYLIEIENNNIIFYNIFKKSIKFKINDIIIIGEGYNSYYFKIKNKYISFSEIQIGKRKSNFVHFAYLLSDLKRKFTKNDNEYIILKQTFVEDIKI